MEDLNIVSKYYENLERQGSGSKEITLKALCFIYTLSPLSKIVNMGCITSGQTITLAQNTPCTITVIDKITDSEK
jgi:hypothetical protein